MRIAGPRYGGKGSDQVDKRPFSGDQGRSSRKPDSVVAREARVVSAHARGRRHGVRAVVTAGHDSAARGSGTSVPVKRPRLGQEITGVPN